MTYRRIAALMGLEAATLVVASTLHLAGAVNDGTRPFRPDRAGIAEAIIAIVLALGALALLRGRRAVAIGSIVFAIAGFGVGLSMTVRGGATGDVAYHVIMLPILVFTLVAACRTPRPAPAPPSVSANVAMSRASESDAAGGQLEVNTTRRARSRRDSD